MCLRPLIVGIPSIVLKLIVQGKNQHNRNYLFIQDTVPEV